MLWDEDFILGLSDKGLQVWANGTVAELVDEMRPMVSVDEIDAICDFMDSHLTWFERVYAFGRADIIGFLQKAEISNKSACIVAFIFKCIR